MSAGISKISERLLTKTASKTYQHELISHFKVAMVLTLKIKNMQVHNVLIIANLDIIYALSVKIEVESENSGLRDLLEVLTVRTAISTGSLD